MRVLFGVRPDLRSDYGGDTTQILRTRDQLQRLGVDVVLADTLDLQPSGFDIVHLFHLTRVYETHAQLRSVRAADPRVPIVLSPIYWPTDEYDRLGRYGLERRLVSALGLRRWEAVKTAAKWMRTRCPRQRRALGATLRCGFEAQQRDLIVVADALLPNSAAEATVLQERFDVPAGKFHVVYNGCDGTETDDASRDANERRPDRILCVGRIEPRKNTLGVIRALRDAPFRLTVVGDAGVYHHRYLRACRRAAGSNVEFHRRLEPSVLRDLYRASAVHVCASWYETPGLVNLEAALNGCRLVVPDRGSVREYFGDTAHYCDPTDETTIRHALDRALTAPHDPAAVHHRLARFTWPKAALSTLAAYDSVIAAEM